MSKFLKKISELTRVETPEEKEEREKAEALANIVKGVDSGENKNPEDVRLANKQKRKDAKVKQSIKKDLALAKVKVSEAGPDFVPRTPPAPTAPFVPSTPPGAPPPPGVPPGAIPPPEKADPLTTEGETWLVNLARKALFIDIDKVGLTDAERELIAKEVTPKNAKKAAKIIHNINVNYGLSEKFDSKIDNLIGDFKKKSPGSVKQMELVA